MTCPPDNSIQSVVFQSDSISIIKGAETLGGISLKDFFIPVSAYYIGKIRLTPATITEITYGNVVTDVTEAKIFCVIPDLSPIVDLDDQVLTWAWLSEDPDFVWNPLGNIMILSGNDTVGVEPLVIANPWDVEIIASILIAV